MSNVRKIYQKNDSGEMVVIDTIEMVVTETTTMDMSEPSAQLSLSQMHSGLDYPGQPKTGQGE
jgi:hypothetical protein